MPFLLDWAQAAVLIIFSFLSTAVYRVPRQNLSIGGSPQEAVKPLAGFTTSSISSSTSHESSRVITSAADSNTDQDTNDNVELPPHTYYGTTDYVYFPLHTNHVTSRPRAEIYEASTHHSPTSSSAQIEYIVTDTRYGKQHAFASSAHGDSMSTDSTWGSCYGEKNPRFGPSEVAIYRPSTSRTFVTRWIREPFEEFWMVWMSQIFQYDMFPVSLGIFLGMVGGAVIRMLSGNTSVAENNARIRSARAKLAAEHEVNLRNARAESTNQYNSKLERDRKIARDAAQLAAQRIAKLESDLNNETELVGEVVRRAEQEKAQVRAALENQNTELRKRLAVKSLQFIKASTNSNMRAKLVRDIAVARFVIRCLKDTVVGYELDCQRDAAHLSALHSGAREKSTQCEGIEDKDSIEQMEETTRDMALQIEQLVGHADKLQDVLDGQKKHLNHKDLVIDRRGETIDDLRKTIDRLNNELNTKQAAIADGNSGMSDQRAIIHEQGKDLDQKDATIKSKDEMISDNQVKISYWRGAAETAQKELDSKDQTLIEKETTWSQESEALKRTNTNQLRKNTILQDKLERGEMRNTMLEKSLDATRKESLEAFDRANEIEKDLREHFKVCTQFQANRDQTSRVTGLQGTVTNTNTEGQQKSLELEIESTRDNGTDDRVQMPTTDPDATNAGTDYNIKPRRRMSEPVIGNTNDQEGAAGTRSEDLSNSDSGTKSMNQSIHKANREQDSDLISPTNTTATVSGGELKHNSQFIAQPDTQSDDKPQQSNKTVPNKTSKLAIKLKQECNMQKPLEEIQRLLDAKICPICANGTHLAAECPEHPILGKNNQVKKDDINDIQPGTAVAPETTEAAAQLTEVRVTTTTPQPQSAPSNPRTSPLIVGGSDDSDDAPAKPKHIPDPKGQGLRRSKWADDYVAPTITTATASSTPMTPSADPTQSAKGQNPTAPVFTPTRPTPTHNPVTGFRLGGAQNESRHGNSTVTPNSGQNRNNGSSRGNTWHNSPGGRGRGRGRGRGDANGDASAGWWDFSREAEDAE